MQQCKSCGRDILFARNVKTGRVMPLDPRAPVYRVQQDGSRQLAALPEKGALVSHFATCAHANKHSRSRRRIPASALRETVHKICEIAIVENDARALSIRVERALRELIGDVEEAK